MDSALLRISVSLAQLQLLPCCVRLPLRASRDALELVSLHKFIGGVAANKAPVQTAETKTAASTSASASASASSCCAAYNEKGGGTSGGCSSARSAGGVCAVPSSRAVTARPSASATPTSGRRRQGLSASNKKASGKQSSVSEAAAPAAGGSSGEPGGAAEKPSLEGSGRRSSPGGRSSTARHFSETPKTGARGLAVPPCTLQAPLQRHQALQQLRVGLRNALTDQSCEGVLVYFFEPCSDSAGKSSSAFVVRCGLLLEYIADGDACVSWAFSARRLSPAAQEQLLRLLFAFTVCVFLRDMPYHTCEELQALQRKTHPQLLLAPQVYRHLQAQLRETRALIEAKCGKIKAFGCSGDSDAEEEAASATESLCVKGEVAAAAASSLQRLAPSSRASSPVKTEKTETAEQQPRPDAEAPPSPSPSPQSRRSRVNLRCRITLDSGDLLLCPRPLLQLLQIAPFSRCTLHREPDCPASEAAAAAAKVRARVSSLPNNAKKTCVSSASRSSRRAASSKSLGDFQESAKEGGCAGEKQPNQRLSTSGRSQEEDRVRAEVFSAAGLTVDGLALHSNLQDASRCSCQQFSHWVRRVIIVDGVELALRSLPLLMEPPTAEAQSAAAANAETAETGGRCCAQGAAAEGEGERERGAEGPLLSWSPPAELSAALRQLRNEEQSASALGSRSWSQSAGRVCTEPLRLPGTHPHVKRARRLCSGEC